MKKLLALLVLLLWSAGAHATCTTGGLPFQLQNNTLADATQVMANFNQITSGVAANCAASGVNNDITALNALATPIGPTVGATRLFNGTNVSGTNTVVVSSVTPSNFTLTQGYCVTFIAAGTNTGATTLAVGGTAAANVGRFTPAGLQTLSGSEIIGGVQYLTCYDGTQWDLVSTSAQYGGFGPLTTLASATTTDLGTIPSHNIQITGTTTITSFGSSATLVFPIVRVMFNNTLVLTQSGSLLLPGGANITTANGDTAHALYLGSGNWQVVDYQRISGAAINPATLLASPTVQRLTSGTGATYTPTTGMVRIKVRECGGGGGGGASNTNAGTAGNTTTFAAWTALGGGAGQTAEGNAGAGGTGGVNGTGTLVQRMSGNPGNPGSVTNAASNSLAGGIGGAGPWGGAGTGGAANGTTTGGTAATNSCGGGGGGANGGSGGGSGEYIEFWMTAAQVGASQTYTVAAAVSGGAAGGSAGGGGAAGMIVVEEFYY